MKKTNENNIKKIKMIVSLITIILVVLVIALISISNNSVDKRIKYIYNEAEEGEIGIMPTNIVTLFTEYAGNINQRSIYKTLYSFADEIVEKYYMNTKGLNSDELKNYYSKNYKDIQKELRIAGEEEFLDFVKTLENLTSDELVLNDYTINPNTVKKRTGYVEFVLILNYKNNDKIGFNVCLYNNSNKSMSPLKFTGNVDKELLDYKYEVVVDEIEKNPLIQSPGKVINN